MVTALFAIAFVVVEDGAVTVCVVIAEDAVVRWVIKGCAKTRWIVGRREGSLCSICEIKFLGGHRWWGNRER